MKTQTPKVIDTNSLKAGRIYSFIYVAPVEMVAKRDGKENPLADCQVFVRRVVKAQSAGNETYANVMRKDNPQWTPSADHKSWWKVSTDNDCIVEHAKLGTRYLRAIPRGIIKEEYFIGAHPATPAEIFTIQSFKKSNGREPSFVLFKTENIQNLQDAQE